MNLGTVSVHIQNLDRAQVCYHQPYPCSPDVATSCRRLVAYNLGTVLRLETRNRLWRTNTAFICSVLARMTCCHVVPALPQGCASAFLTPSRRHR